MILFLDTSNFDTIYFALLDADKLVKEKTFQLGHRDSNKIVGELGKFLPAKIRAEKSLEKIVIVSGPGSFTGIRVGVATSLAISLAWEVPVFAIEKDSVPANLPDVTGLKKLKRVTQKFEPFYGAEPNITPAKKK